MPGVNIGYVTDKIYIGGAIYKSIGKLDDYADDMGFLYYGPLLGVRLNKYLRIQAGYQLSKGTIGTLDYYINNTTNEYSGSVFFGGFSFRVSGGLGVNFQVRYNSLDGEESEFFIDEGLEFLTLNFGLSYAFGL